MHVSNIHYRKRHYTRLLNNYPLYSISIGPYKPDVVGRILHRRDEYGWYILVECKNWSTAIGASEIRDFIGKMDSSKTRLGVVFARNGISGESKGAQKKIEDEHQTNNTMVIVSMVKI
ncbi:restriction endonuclease [Halalkalicoccus salilacus]|uniref:restriction endonuclease n=1 Tax=Halalkalicoccus salilacus TaxID=3117459 RepID=UPI0038D47592